MPYLLQFMRYLDYMSLRTTTEKFQHFVLKYYQDILSTAKSYRDEVLSVDFIDNNILNDLGRSALTNKETIGCHCQYWEILSFLC